jgi:hypothetical protein
VIMLNASDSKTLVLVMKLREALKYADTELQRRCVISTKIREALTEADTFLAQIVAEQPMKNITPKSPDCGPAPTGRNNWTHYKASPSD